MDLNMFTVDLFDISRPIVGLRFCRAPRRTTETIDRRRGTNRTPNVTKDVTIPQTMGQQSPSQSV